MAVYTEVGEPELSAFIGAYDLGAVLSYKGIAEGVENSNFLLRTEGGTFILTLYERRVNEKELPFFLGLMDHLAHRGLNCPVPVRASDGEALRILAGRPAAIFTFLEGMATLRPETHHCRMLGAAMGRLHRLAADFPQKRANALAVAAWRPLFQSCGEEVDRLAAGLSATIATELDRLETSWPSGLPEGIIHADLFPDNVFFLAGELSGLIDFYFACNDILAYDIAIGLCAWCFEPDHSFNVTKAKALIEGYALERPLAREELQALPLLCRGAAMRFLLTRLYDWLNVPEDSFVTKKDPMEYLRKLRFHQQARSAAAYGIVEEALGA